MKQFETHFGQLRRDGVRVLEVGVTAKCALESLAGKIYHSPLIKSL